MQYTSNLISDYSAVLLHLDKLKARYQEYGISFETTILVSEQGYKVRAEARELAETN